MRLHVENLGCSRSGRPIFSGVQLSLGTGEALAVRGPNGAGKSSLLRILAGLLPPASGLCRIEGVDEDTPLSECAHYLGHRDALKPTLSPLAYLRFWQALLGQPAASPDEALARVGLAHAAVLPSAWLSAGQRRRLALARLLVAKRPLWLLDEPTTALDAVSEHMFSGMVARHLAEGGMAIIATHAPLGFDARIYEFETRS